MLSRGVVFQRGALNPLEGFANVALNSGACAVQKTELALCFRTSLVRRFVKPAGCFREIAIHAQTQLKGAGNLELLLQVATLSALKQLVGKWLVLRKRRRASQAQGDRYNRQASA